MRYSGTTKSSNTTEIKNHKTGSGYPLGACPTENGVMFSAYLPYRKSFELIIFNSRGEIKDHVNMLDHMLASGVVSCIVEGPWEEDDSYCFEIDGVRTSDPFMRNSTALRKFGDHVSDIDNGRLCLRDFDWEGDDILHIPYDRVIAYQLHVRGFTAHSSSKVRARGKYAGIIEKIPYFCELGINQIVLMPSYEFDEIIRPGSRNNSMDNLDYRTDPAKTDKPRINLWGFTRGMYYMPKAAYSEGDPVNEFKEMVKSLHAAGIEVIMRFYFPDSANRTFIPSILRFWAYEYHIDGFFLMGSDIPMDMIASDVYLNDRKIYNNFFDKDGITHRKYGFNPNMAFVNSDFMNTCRRFLKSDEDQLSDFLYRQRLNPSDVHTVNYMTDYYGFTLNDLVSYDYKHNEANDEDNNDGENFNYSWNCGAEGTSRRKSIISLRTKQIKNALVFLMLAQGTPMLCAGDEFLNSQHGNNNPYCQDNEIGWVVWKSNNRIEEIRGFVRMLINLRKEHPILHPDREFRLMDYAACGFPDLSYHGDQAWNPKYYNHLRHIGVMICGKYARLTRTREDDFFYMAYNMHWEDHTFALPKLPKGLKWSVCFMTCDDTAGAVIYDTLGGTHENVTVPDRTVAVLVSVEDKDAIKDIKTEKRSDKK
ncbi:MAG: hypothetical protein J5367_06120 [Lachnospiraceae bacterium]|nr:hypothetical protein [Lachnospiraceae bacterium]